MARTRVTPFSSSKLALMIYISEDDVIIPVSQVFNLEAACDLCGQRANFLAGPGVQYCRADLEAMIEAEPERWYLPATQIR